MISIKGLYKQFDELEVLKGIDLEVGKGEVVVDHWSIRFREDHDASLFKCIGNSNKGFISIEGQSIGLFQTRSEKKYCFLSQLNRDGFSRL